MLLGVSLAASCPGVLATGIIGNIPLEQMKAQAASVVGATIADVSNTPAGSTWTIRVVKSYQGSAQATIIATADYSPSSDELNWLRSRPGIFMISRTGSLVRRTGSSRATDYFVPVSGEFSKIADRETAFCVDWMRGLTDPAALIVRDLAVAATYCGGDTARADAIRGYLAPNSVSTDRIVSILLGLSRGEPSALKDLQACMGQTTSIAWNPVIVDNLQFQLAQYASPDLTGVQTLRELAESTADRTIQISAVTSLATIHSDETWPHLTLLLNSSDPEIRRLAIAGLYQTVLSGLGEHPFEHPLTQQGQRVRRNVRQRPRVLDSAIPRTEPTNSMSAQPVDDSTMLTFWKSFAAQNR